MKTFVNIWLCAAAVALLQGCSNNTDEKCTDYSGSFGCSANQVVSSSNTCNGNCDVTDRLRCCTDGVSLITLQAQMNLPSKDDAKDMSSILRQTFGSILGISMADITVALQRVSDLPARRLSVSATYEATLRGSAKLTEDVVNNINGTLFEETVEAEAEKRGMNMSTLVVGLSKAASKFSEACAAEWGNCGGDNYMRKTCCGDSFCNKTNAWYFQCNPGSSPPAPAQQTQTPGCTASWANCGGKDYPTTTCCSGLYCDTSDAWYYQCLPIPDVTTTTAATTTVQVHAGALKVGGWAYGAQWCATCTPDYTNWGDGASSFFIGAFQQNAAQAVENDACSTLATQSNLAGVNDCYFTVGGAGVNQNCAALTAQWIVDQAQAIQANGVDFDMEGCYQLDYSSNGTYKAGLATFNQLLQDIKALNSTLKLVFTPLGDIVSDGQWAVTERSDVPDIDYIAPMLYWGATSYQDGVTISRINSWIDSWQQAGWQPFEMYLTYQSQSASAAPPGQDVLKMLTQKASGGYRGLIGWPSQIKANNAANTRVILDTEATTPAPTSISPPATTPSPPSAPEVALKVGGWSFGALWCETCTPEYNNWGHGANSFFIGAFQPNAAQAVGNDACSTLAAQSNLAGDNDCYFTVGGAGVNQNCDELTAQWIVDQAQAIQANGVDFDMEGCYELDYSDNTTYLADLAEFNTLLGQIKAINSTLKLVFTPLGDIVSKGAWAVTQKAQVPDIDYIAPMFYWGATSYQAGVTISQINSWIASWQQANWQPADMYLTYQSQSASAGSPGQDVLDSLTRTAANNEFRGLIGWPSQIKANNAANTEVIIETYNEATTYTE